MHPLLWTAGTLRTNFRSPAINIGCLICQFLSKKSSFKINHLFKLICISVIKFFSKLQNRSIILLLRWSYALLLACLLLRVSCIASGSTQFLIASEHFNPHSKAPLAIYLWRVIIYVWNGCSKHQAGSIAIIRDLLCLCYWLSADIWLLNTLSIYIAPKNWQLRTNSKRQSSLIELIFMTFVTAALQGSSSRLSSGLMLNKEIRWNSKHFSRIVSFTRIFWVRSQSCIRFLKELDINP